MQHKTCIVVGNGDLDRDLSAEIDAADYVLRFNSPRLLDGWSGTRTDRLMMSNSGKPMQFKLQDTDFPGSVFVRNAGDIVLVYHPAIMRQYFKKPWFFSKLLKGRKVDWTYEAIDILGAEGKPVIVMPPQFYLDACAEIGITGPALHRQFPSTGYLGLRDLLRRLPSDTWKIKLCGFSWQGWKRHNWDNEKNWVSTQVDKGLLTLME